MSDQPKPITAGELRKLQASLDRSSLITRDIALGDQVAVSTIRRLISERSADKAIIATLPKTADKVTIVPGMTLWYRSPAGIIETPTLDSWAEIEDVLSEDEDMGPKLFFSTLEALYLTEAKGERDART